MCASVRLKWLKDAIRDRLNLIFDDRCDMGLTVCSFRQIFRRVAPMLIGSL